jgi:hypothetical protein
VARISASTLGSPRVIELLAALTVLLLFASQAPALEFYGEQDADGGVRVVNDIGAEVNALTGNPIGSRPDFCPSGSYYFTELDSDKAQLVLNACSSDAGEYPVQLLAN